LLSGRRRIPALAPALIAPLAALAAYLPAIVVPYAYMDDYFVLGWREGLGGDFYKTATSFGRPFHALSLRGAFALASDIDSLRLVRLVGLLGVMVLAVLLYYALRHAELGRWLSTGVCVSVVSLASFQVYVSWAATFEAPYVAALGGLAWLRLRSGFGLRGRAAWIRRAEAAALLLCALLTYQPAAMFFWVFAAIDLLRPTEELAYAARKLGESLGVAAVAMFFAYAAVRVGVHFYGGATSGRTNLVHDLVDKTRWFLNEPLVNSLAMFELVPTESLALAVAIVAAAGILLLHAHSGRRAFGFLGLALVLIPLSYLPNLAVAEQFASYRSIGALSTLLTLYLWLGIWGISRSLLRFAADGGGKLVVARTVSLALAALLSFVSLALIILPLAHVVASRPASGVSLDTLTSWPELATFVLLFLLFGSVGLWAPSVAKATGVATVTTFALAGVLVAARNVTTLFVEPQSVELQLLRSSLASPSAPDPPRVVFVKPNWTQGPAPLVRYDEFGLPSTYFAWVPNPATLLVLGERLHRRANPTIDVLPWDARAPDAEARPGDAFVDMRKLQRRHVGWSVWTLHAARPATAPADAPSARRP
jgi:hypothetical protein